MNRLNSPLLAFLLLFIFCLSASQVIGSRQGLYSIGVSLHSYQASNGGFHNGLDGPASLEGTSSALFLAGLLGETHTIDPDAAAAFLNNFEINDLDLSSVREVVLAQHYLKRQSQHIGKIQSFIQSLYDSKTKLFANRPGQKGDLRSTALAFDVLRLLGSVKSGTFKDSVESVKSYLSSHEVVSDQAQFSFPEETTLDDISANYYATLLGAAVDYDFNLPKLAHFIAGFQDKEGANAGGFFATKQRTGVSLTSTYRAAATLLILQQHYDKEVFIERIDQDALVKYATHNPASTLRDAAKAFTILATTKKFLTEYLDAKFAYEVLGGVPGNTIVQGTQIKPVVQVKSIDGTPRQDLSADVTVTIAGGAPSKAKLEWSQDSQYYLATKYIDTSYLLGQIVLDYTLSVAVPALGESRVHHKIERKIGYAISVDAHASLDATGKKIERGETVAMGTAFKFGVSLQNKTHDAFTSGRFFVSFFVVESSGAIIHNEVVDASKAHSGFSFSYTLNSPRVPSGELSFKFEVLDDKKKPHSYETVSYQLATPMIASEINFDGASTFKIGQKVKVSMVPATFPDLRTVYTLENNEAAKSRSFFLDIKSSGGTLLRSVKGVSSGDRYVFEFTISNTFEFVGTNTVSFRYVAANGEDIPLSNYDSSAKELYEDPSALSYNVNAALELVDVSAQPTPDSFFYGNEIQYKFRVRDSVSGEYILASPSFDAATIFLSLSHEEKSGRVSRSVHIPASSSGKDFSISWVINPNAVQGSGVVSLSAQDADGNVIAIVDQKTKKATQYNVNIGGSIDVESRPYVASSLLIEESAFVVEFSLSCQNKRLKDAQLRANVVLNNAAEPLYSLLPVVTNADGSYSVSWTVPAKQELSGHYQLQFFREVDARANASPLFTVEFNHSTGLKTLPVQTEFLVALIVGAAFLSLSYKRNKLANAATLRK